jgi:hypothetical protein
MPIDPKLLDYATTDRQREVLETLLEVGSKRGAAAKLGIDAHHVRKVVRSAEREAAKKGYSPQHGINRPLPEHLMLTGSSALVNEQTGQTVMQWYKSGVDRHQMRQMLVAAADAVTSTLAPEPVVEPPSHTVDELMSVYILTDYHMGMLSWAVETGDSWDMRIAEQAIYDWAAQAVTLVPRSSRAVFAQLGDLLHYDTLDSVTPANRNALDADSRYPKIVEATVRALRRVIRLLLTHHKEVLILMAEGNHDPVSSVWLRELFTALYENEPRVNVEKSPLPYYCVEHGKTSVYFHHGHIRKPRQIAEVFAAQFREVLGRTVFSYAHMGHMHHTQVHETPLMIVEQHQTLAAKDAYAARGGWHSQRAAQVITYSKQHGEISRIRIPFSMIRREEIE